MKSRLIVPAISTIAVAALLVHGGAAKTRAKNGCSNATLEGTYGLRSTGTVASGPTAGPIGIVGIISYDGAGQLTATLTQRVSGASGPTTLEKVPYVGTYSVGPDCSVDDVWHNLSNGTSSAHESAIVDHGNGFFIIGTSAGPSIVTGEARKQFPAHDDRN